MLQQDFVPVAIDQWYQRRQQDAEGEFYRKIAGQGPRNDFKQTTQGRYVCTADGKLLGYNNNHADLERLKKLMRQARDGFDPVSYKGIKPIVAGSPDLEYHITAPVDGLVLRVYSKILGGYQEPRNARETAFQKSIGWDNCWIQKAEKEALIKAVKEDGAIPAIIAQRIARYHLIDNTRGEPPRWSIKEIKSLKLNVKNGAVRGSVKLGTSDQRRGYEAQVYGHIETDGNSKVTRFELVIEGDFWGAGRYTRQAPKGKFPLVVTFRLVEKATFADRAVPHGAKGWLEGYYQPGR